MDTQANYYNQENKNFEYNLRNIIQTEKSAVELNKSYSILLKDMETEVE